MHQRSDAQGRNGHAHNPADHGTAVQAPRQPPRARQVGRARNAAGGTCPYPRAVIARGLEHEGQAEEKDGEHQRQEQYPEPLTRIRAHQCRPGQGVGPLQGVLHRAAVGCLGPVHDGAQQVQPAESDSQRPVAGGAGAREHLRHHGPDTDERRATERDGQPGRDGARPRCRQYGHGHGDQNAEHQVPEQPQRHRSGQWNMASDGTGADQLDPALLLLGAGGANDAESAHRSSGDGGESAHPPEGETACQAQVEGWAQDGPHRRVGGQAREHQVALRPGRDEGVVLGDGGGHQQCQHRHPDQPEQPAAAQQQPEDGPEAVHVTPPSRSAARTARRGWGVWTSGSRCRRR